jgi:hypothetical protein
MPRKRKNFFHEHSLTLVAAAILVTWIVLYSRSDPRTRAGAFFGNASADWSGVVVMVLGTKYLYERGSAESNPVPRDPGGKLKHLLRAHSLTLILLITGAGWLALFLRMDPDSKWGQVVGNVLSEWVQVIGLILLTKRFFEAGSHESSRR